MLQNEVDFSSGDMKRLQIQLRRKLVTIILIFQHNYENKKFLLHSVMTIMEAKVEKPRFLSQSSFQLSSFIAIAAAATALVMDILRLYIFVVADFILVYCFHNLRKFLSFLFLFLIIFLNFFLSFSSLISLQFKNFTLYNIVCDLCLVIFHFVSIIQICLFVRINGRTDGQNTDERTDRRTNEIAANTKADRKCK